MNSIEINQISVVVTYNCNLQCKYCFVSNKSNVETIDISTIHKAVDMWNNLFSGNKQHLKILFTGGEPLIKKDFILSAINELEKEYPEISFEYHITTNGLLLTDDFLLETIKRNIFICVSTDGNAISNKERFNETTNHYERIQKNIIAYAEKLNEKKMRVRMTITPQNVSHFYENVNHFTELGIKNIHFSPNYEDEWDDNSIELYFQAYRRLGDYVKDNIIIEPYISFCKDGVDKNGPYEHDCSFLPTISTNGDVFFCPRFAGKQIQKLGNVEKPFEVLLNFRKIVGSIDKIFKKEKISFICPSNYLEKNNVVSNFKKFHDNYKKKKNNCFALKGLAENNLINNSPHI